MFPFYPFGNFNEDAIGAYGIYNSMLRRDIGLDLPEEVRAALEERTDEIKSGSDMRRIANDLLRRS